MTLTIILSILFSAAEKSRDLQNGSAKNIMYGGREFTLVKHLEKLLGRAMVAVNKDLTADQVGLANLRRSTYDVPPHIKAFKSVSWETRKTRSIRISDSSIMIFSSSGKKLHEALSGLLCSLGMKQQIIQ